MTQAVATRLERKHPSDMGVTLEQVLEHIDKLPEPPKASLQALSMLEDPNVPIAKVSEFIGMDECMTSKLLKLSNSAHYGYSGKVTTIKEAMMRIGTNIVKSTLYAAMVEMTGMSASPFFVELWKSALFTAFLSKDVAELMQHPRPDVCFTAGLLADVGQLLLNQFAPKIYPSLIAEVRKGGYDLVQAETQVFGLSHIRVGSNMADAWKLPILYQNVIRYHHDPINSFHVVLPDDYKVVVAVHIATNLSPLFGYQSGVAIQYEAMKKAGLTTPVELLLPRLKQKFEVYHRDLTKITGLMFGDAIEAA